MHLLGRTDDGIHRTCLDAQCAPDTCAFIDYGDRPLAFSTMHRIEWNDGFAQQCGDTRYALGTARRALVIACAAGSDRFCIGATSGIAALGALRLRQQIFDTIGECLG